MKSLLHVVAVVLTVLLFFIKPPNTLAAVCYKRLNPSYKYYPGDLVKSAPTADESCHARAYHSPPKYKRDPEIDVDNEQIGQYPLI